MTVVDASVVLRRLTWGSSEADEVLRRPDLVAPAVITTETASGLVKEVRAGLDPAAAAALLRHALELPIALVPDPELAVGALGYAREFGLSASDALYVTLAERLETPVVTADRKLAARYPRCELIP